MSINSHASIAVLTLTIILLPTLVSTMTALHFIGFAALVGLSFLFENAIISSKQFQCLHPLLKASIHALVLLICIFMAHYLLAYFQLAAPYTFANKVGAAIGIFGFFIWNYWTERLPKSW